MHLHVEIYKGMDIYLWVPPARKTNKMLESGENIEKLCQIREIEKKLKLGDRFWDPFKKIAEQAGVV